MGSPNDRISPRAWFICVANILFNVNAFLLTVFPSVILGDLKSSLHFTPLTSSCLMSATLLAALLFQMPAGILINRFGARWVLTGAASLCAAATYLFALADSVGLVIVAQFWIGVGVCFALVGSVNLYSLWLPKRWFAAALGTTQAASMGGALFGNWALAALAESLGWQPAVFLLATATVGVAIVLGVVLRNAPDSQASSGEDVRLADVVRIACKPQAWLLGCYEGMSYGPILAVTGFWGITELEQSYGLTKTTAAIIDDVVFVANALGAVFFGYFSDRVCRRAGLMRMASLLVVACALGLIWMPPPSLPLAATTGVLFLIGFLASTNVLAFATARDVFTTKEKEVAAVFVNLVGTVLTIGLSEAAGALIEMRAVPQSGGPPVNVAGDYVFAVNTVVAACAVAALLVSLAVQETYCKVVPGEVLARTD